MKLIVGGLCVGTIAIVVLLLLASLRRDTRAATPAWPTIDLPRDDGSETSMRVVIVETEGACLYIVRGGDSPAVAAVPKTQLASGVGCGVAHPPAERTR